jgi:hypothetical protein
VMGCRRLGRIHERCRPQGRPQHSPRGTGEQAHVSGERGPFVLQPRERRPSRVPSERRLRQPRPRPERVDPRSTSSRLRGRPDRRGASAIRWRSEQRLPNPELAPVDSVR